MAASMSGVRARLDLVSLGGWFGTFREWLIYGASPSGRRSARWLRIG